MKVVIRRWSVSLHPNPSRKKLIPEEPEKSDPKELYPIDVMSTPNYSPPPTSDMQAGDTPITQAGEHWESEWAEEEWTGEWAQDEWTAEWAEQEWTGERAEEEWTAEWAQGEGLNDDDWVRPADWWYDTERKDSAEAGNKSKDHAWYDPDPSMRADDESHRSADDHPQRRSPWTRDKESPYARRTDDGPQSSSPWPRREESPYARRMDHHPQSPLAARRRISICKAHG